MVVVVVVPLGFRGLGVREGLGIVEVVAVLMARMVLLGPQSLFGGSKWN